MMTLSKDTPQGKRPRPEKPAPKYPWLLPLFVIVAIVVLVGAFIAIAATGIHLF